MRRTHAIDGVMPQIGEMMEMMQGDKLTNGFVVIEVSKSSRDGWGFVLAMKGVGAAGIGDLKRPDPSRFATWQVRIDDPESTSTGHYHTTIEGAVIDFLRRTTGVSQIARCLSDAEMERLELVKAVTQ